MAQVSKYPVHKDVEKRMFEIFRSSISSLRDASDIDDFLQDFLSPVEKIMLAKRLSIAVLLGKGYSYPEIRRILRVNPSTIASVSLNLKYAGRGYKRIVEKILTDEKIDAFWQKIDDILINIPPGKSANWSYQRKEHEKRKRHKQKAF